MPFSVFSHLLCIERHRPRITRSAFASGFATPALGEYQLSTSPQDPLLATNMRGTFLGTRPSRENVVRYGFTVCPLNEEGVLVTELARVLWELSEVHAWDIRCKTVAAAVASFEGHVPRSLVVSARLAQEVLGQDAPPPEGFVGNIDKMQVLVTSLPENVALVALAPTQAGNSTRVGDNVGMIIRPRAFRVVRT